MQFYECGGVGGALRAVHEVSMTTAPSILLIGDYGMFTPPPPPPPQMHTNTVSIVKERRSMGEGGRDANQGREKGEDREVVF